MSLQSSTISRNHEKAPSRHHQQHSTRPENGIFATFRGPNILQIGKQLHFCRFGIMPSCHRHRKTNLLFRFGFTELSIYINH